MRDTIIVFIGIVVGMIAAVLLIGLIITTIATDPAIARYQTLCAENGGHIYKPSSIYFCLTQDGRFIEIYP